MSRAEIVRLRGDGLSYSEIAARLGTTRGVVAGALRSAREGLAVGKPFPYTDEEVRAALTANGNSRRATARTLGITEKAVARRALMPANRTSFSPNRATEPAVREVCDMVARCPHSLAVISEVSGVAVHTIWRWRAGKPANPQFVEWVREALVRLEQE